MKTIDEQSDRIQDLLEKHGYVIDYWKYCIPFDQAVIYFMNAIMDEVAEVIGVPKDKLGKRE